ncbi:hypothetical protein AYL99_03751 [Fonsecaea erecta]|uniref:Uncharacterized protein n=1 Tax=Fonsecaea erecta TaxID=1367422 RepID=A0A178ZP03_9EURO|nr:hypothetical protein AYL99_03751 [Fonsecaea erecta]OAP61548.1 hypothetical protein AYL99_03751 [Fonsecaea erecta]
MAGFSTPMQNARTPSQQQPKQMSSRLLNMKFMQRAAASTPNATSTPASSTGRTPATEPLAKRRKIDSMTSSPVVASTPGTPSIAPQDTSLGIAPRGGTSSSTRFEGADTEWVLDLKMKSPGDGEVTSPSHKNAHANRGGSKSRFGLLYNRRSEEDEEAEDEEGEEEEEEEDIWNNNRPSGRQTFGSFDRKKRTLRPSTGQQDQPRYTGDDQDLSSASDSDSGSDPDSDSEADLSVPTSSNRPTPRRRQQQQQQGRRASPTKPAADIDSDEEMNRVRMAIEQKHRSMAGSGHVTRNVTIGGGTGKSRSVRPEAGDKRKRAEQQESQHEGNNDKRKKNKNKNKKARKTL